jgi:hypothetical protein
MEKAKKQITKKVILVIDNSRWMDSLESAFLKFTSPTGNSIFIKKIKLRSFSLEEKS